MESPPVHSGLSALDEVLQGLRYGDNVVWQVDCLEDYQHFAQPFASRALREERDLVYVRFAPHPPVVEAGEGLTVAEVDPSEGFDHFTRAVHQIMEEHGVGAYYIFDNLSSLVAMWATDELLANFFQVTCPFLAELETVAYFALTRGRHGHSTVARIRDTTQILIDVYRVRGEMYVHPLRVWDRYSPTMFLPHRVSDGTWAPVSQSVDAADVAATALRQPLPAATDAIAPWESVYNRLTQYARVAAQPLAANAEFLALKQELCRMMMGTQPEFTELALRYLTVEDFCRIRDRMIGSGRIGGKAAGMLLARRILVTDEGDDGIRFSEVLEGHDSFYIGSDVFFTFLVNNDLFRQRLRLTRNSQLSWDEFGQLEERFLAGKFSLAIMEQFRSMLDYFGQAPIIVRSSSLLEDSFGNAFAGKYRSEFCTNQGHPDARLEAFLRAVRLVYASALNPHALAYRRKRGLGESDEQMAILVQRVSGAPHEGRFFPSLAGVAFSRNLYAWSDRIDPARGIIRLVFGLGTRAVERVGSDYPRMIPVSHPELRPEVGAKVVRYSQHQVDLLDLQGNRFVTVPLEDALGRYEARDLRLFVSTVADGYVSDPAGTYLGSNRDGLVLTFNNLIRQTNFVEIMGNMLARLERGYGRPVDTEFTASVGANGVRVNLLQCRPLRIPGASESSPADADIPPERTLFRSSRMIFGGVVRDIRYVLYIDPARYSTIREAGTKTAIGRIVSRLNAHPSVIEGKVIMMGPGRWGSTNIDLGVSVGYGDIDNAAVLVEVAREEAGQLPELSYGTHFFQDLVEAGVIFLAVYPDDAESHFNAGFFAEAPNALRSLSPEAARYEAYVTVIDVPSAADGAHAHVVADPERGAAVCFLR
jgi:pyruvate,water dikinase